MRRSFLLIIALCACIGLHAQAPTEAHADTIYTYDTVRIVDLRQYTDTLMHVLESPDSIAQQRIDTLRPDSSDRRGHYIEAHVGLGYGSLGYSLSGNGNRVNGSFSGVLQLQYAYFFHPNWGVGAGLWFTNYISYAHLAGSYQWLDQTDSDGEPHYDHTATINRWRERQAVYDIGIPISLHFQYQKESWKARLFASLGIAPSFALSHSYRLQQGEIAHSGYYPAWKMTLTDVHEFGIKDYTSEASAKGNLSVRPRATLFADLGALFPITKQIDLFTGGYFHCALNDANSSNKTALGWQDDTFAFMDPYNGAYATTNAGASHPWEVGVKIGVHWHYIAPDKHTTVDYFDYFTRRDTSYEYIAHCDTIVSVRIDTSVQIIPAHIIEAAERVEKFNKIFFAFNKYELTHKAQRYLSSIVGVLNDVPDAKIAIDGHASPVGDDEYNDWLSRQRANAVAEYLVRQGVNKDRIVAVGYGSRVPNDENTDRAESLDRRVEVKVVLQPTNIPSSNEGKEVQP
ncbi:MAG: OmpA family protein [Paludibacteraceae bacterium]|nr:OmpA family protein [Paludibacteraceae bacterium]